MNIDEIIEMMSNDILIHGLLNDYVNSNAGNKDWESNIKNILDLLLNSGKVQIGSVSCVTSGCVEFVAWNGTTESRVNRAMIAIRDSREQDREFAYWLCLSGNVDRFEEDLFK